MIRDAFARRELAWQRLMILGPLTIALPVFVATQCAHRTDSPPEVVLYAAQDRVYAEPILADFTQATGIRVRTVFDSEATKTVGLANRLLAEQAHPRCDVFWGNEELRTRQLAARGVFDETNGWAAFGQRSRRLAVATRGHPRPTPSPAAPVPGSFQELTNTIYRGRVVLAYPLFGTTAAHFLALRQHWGVDGWRQWCHALSANHPFLVDGNSVAVQFLTRGEADVALTDSDDIAAAQREGAAIQALPTTAETLLIPNTVGLVRGGPHPDAARQLYTYLQTTGVVQRLIAAGALEQNERPASAPSPPASLRPDWDALVRDLEPAMEELQGLFRR